MWEMSAWTRGDEGKKTTINRSGDAAVGPIGSVAGEVEGKMSRKVRDSMSRVKGWNAAGIVVRW